ncbi:predicted protein [Phaeodactylum tricornutum CCAP 1055/1]|jgi:hypothetical protein|uniref:Transmembrane protein n=1 Tax=Phaeodactylum tricornutum (strain CCAP 1055/1) TaxID=556484 RepID=B7G418_PHATC|nr:predicted protein [Phaeodactylum tricornutum CCAP 1055/1]EEC46378.1 predicted protein [Phaeodactylum tricornutum CCAP 1055/1]|eukprot:XP_002181838.1 predicted protein [Phaeodactylum tricornutum CCAP 1055/1]
MSTPDVPPRTPAQARHDDEAFLVQGFATILHYHNDDIIAIRRIERDVDRDNIRTDFTPYEKKVLRISNYRNYHVGLAAGAFTMAVLSGITLWRTGTVRSVPLQKLVTNTKTQAYTQFDGVARRTQTPHHQQHHHNRNVPPKQPWRSEELDSSEASSPEIITSLHNMVFGAIAIVVTVVTANATLDRKAYVRGLSTVPLLPGSSQFCQRVCPALQEHYDRTIKSSVKLPQGHDAQTLWNDPVTDELESIVIMLHNCRQRQAFEADLRQSQTSPPPSWHKPVHIPPPGVPSNYLGISVGDAEQLTTDAEEGQT